MLDEKFIELEDKQARSFAPVLSANLSSSWRQSIQHDVSRVSNTKD